jgi:hypothetical protein
MLGVLELAVDRLFSAMTENFKDFLRAWLLLAILMFAEVPIL